MGHKCFVVGVYSDGLTTILGDYPSVPEARRAVRWQEHPGQTTKWHICEPDPEARGVMVDHETGERLTCTRGALTQEAHDRLFAEIWG